MRRTLVATITIGSALVATTLTGLTGPAGASGEPDKVTQSTTADVGEYPGQVLVLPPEQPISAYCGGTHILPDWVLTAAHCVDNGPGEPPSTPDAVIGTNVLDGSGTRVSSTETFVHPDYDFPANDIALLHLETAVPGSLGRLAFPGQDVLETPGREGYVTGWGGLSSDEDNQSFPDELQEGLVPIIPDADCDATLTDDYNQPLPVGFEPLIVCAGLGNASDEEQADACRGDSGGPLWVAGDDGNRRQVGIVSGGPTCGLSPTYYTSVQTFMPFIEQTVGMQLASFPDIVNITLEREVENLVVHGITAGNAQGLFDPSGLTSRAQLASFINRVLDLPAPAPGTPHPFTDVDGTGTHDANIEALFAGGVVTSSPDGRFRPADQATRAEMAGFIARALQLDPVAEGPFSDVPPTHPEAGSINALADRGVFLVPPDGLFRPDNQISRAQISAVLVRAFLAAG